MLTILFINLIYIAICWGIIKIRNSNNLLIRQWDNGNVFLEKLDEENARLYWQKDTQIVKIFMVIFGLFLEICCILILANYDIVYLALCIGAGIVVATTTALVLSGKLRKQFNKK